VYLFSSGGDGTLDVAGWIYASAWIHAQDYFICNNRPGLSQFSTPGKRQEYEGGILVSETTYVPPHGVDYRIGPLSVDDFWDPVMGSTYGPYGLSAGTYFFTSTLYGKLTLDSSSYAGRYGVIVARFYNTTTGLAASSEFVVVIGKSLTDSTYGNATHSTIITVAEGNDIIMQAKRVTDYFGGGACTFDAAYGANAIIFHGGNIVWHRLY
jgi:hypothetical protein